MTYNVFGGTLSLTLSLPLTLLVADIRAWICNNESVGDGGRHVLIDRATNHVSRSHDDGCYQPNRLTDSSSERDFDRFIASLGGLAAPAGLTRSECNYNAKVTTWSLTYNLISPLQPPVMGLLLLLWPWVIRLTSLISSPAATLRGKLINPISNFIFNPNRNRNHKYHQQVFFHVEVGMTEISCSYCLAHFAIDLACIDHYARTVSEWTKHNSVSFGLRDMIRRFRDCLGR